VNEDSFALDLETTGVDTKTDTPVQISLIHQSAEGVRRTFLNSLVRPASNISPEATQIHGIADDMVTAAPDYGIVAWNVHLLYVQMMPKYLVTFNGKTFDEPILNRCLGQPVFPGVLHLDVCDIAYRHFPMLPNHRLGTVYAEFMGKELLGAHGASADANATLDLLQAIRVKLGMTLDQLASEMSKPKPYAIIPIGKYKGTMIDDMGIGWARYMRDNATDMRPDLQATVDYIIRSKSRQ